MKTEMVFCIVALAGLIMGGHTSAKAVEYHLAIEQNTVNFTGEYRPAVDS